LAYVVGNVQATFDEYKGALFSSTVISLSNTYGIYKNYHDKKVWLVFWDIKTRKLLSSIDFQNNEITSMAISPLEDMVVVCEYYGDLKIFELPSIKLLKSIKIRRGNYSVIKYSPEGRYCVVCDNAGEIIVIDVLNARVVLELSDNEGGVTAADISSDGNFLVTGGKDGSLVFWNLKLGNRMIDIGGHTNKICSVEFSKGGRFVITGSSDNNLKFWRVNWDLEFPHNVEWDAIARPYIQQFLNKYPPYKGGVFRRKVIRQWTEKEFKILLNELQQRGLGWISPDGIRKQLEQISIEMEKRFGEQEM
jgi:WD40 repeat protein